MHNRCGQKINRDENPKLIWSGLKKLKVEIILHQTMFIIVNLNLLSYAYMWQTRDGKRAQLEIEVVDGYFMEEGDSILGIFLSELLCATLQDS